MGQCLYGRHGSLSSDAQHNKNLGIVVLEMQTGESLDFAGQPDWYTLDVVRNLVSKK